jgi:hypothetical protein
MMIVHRGGFVPLSCSSMSICFCIEEDLFLFLVVECICVSACAFHARTHVVTLKRIFWLS